MATKSHAPSLFRCFRRPKTPTLGRKPMPRMPETPPAITGTRSLPPTPPARSCGSGHSASPEDYRLMEEIGSGGSATVYRAIYVPTGEIVAVKCLDLDRCDIDLEDIRREAQTMSLINHPNLLKAYCSFVVGHSLWVVMPFMAEGSCLHLMKFAHPDGLEEPAIASILKETLQALAYLHKHGHIHRDVKAGNILLDSSGAVKLADFGVSAFMFDNGDRKRSRSTFKGTPCWMAPEVMQPGSQYDFKADIWSFGITALELAHGHAPFSRYPPMKVLLMTLQNAPPELNYDRDRRFSKSFKQMIGTCLVKDQTKRPSAETLLKDPFFKNAISPELSVKSIFADLPPLWDRVRQLQMKDAEQLALKQMPSAEQEALSQSEYQRGVSAWKFDIEDLKEQASLIPDDEVSEEYEETGTLTSVPSPGKLIVNGEMYSRGNINGENESGASCSSKSNEKVQTDPPDSNNHGNVEDCEHHMVQNDLSPSTSKRNLELNQLKLDVPKKELSVIQDMASILQRIPLVDRRQATERTEEDDGQAVGKFKRDAYRVPNLSGPLMLINRASANSLSAPTQSSGSQIEPLGDKSKPNVQIKGRFSVTSGNMDLAKDIPITTISNKSAQRVPLKKSASVGEEFIQSKPMLNGHQTKDSNNSAVPASVIFSHLQNLLHQKTVQQNLIVNILNVLQQNEQIDASQGATNTLLQNKEHNTSLETANGESEQFLLAKISELHTWMVNLTDELTAEKSKHTRLQQQLNDLEKQEIARHHEVGRKTDEEA